MTMWLKAALVAGGALVALPTTYVPAWAQQQGITSGPAVGTAVVPSTTAQKQGQTGNKQAGSAASQGAIGVGAPGVAAKSGAEGGSSPGPGSGKRP